VETVLQRLARASGLLGLSGILPAFRLQASGGPLLCRPLLEVCKDRLYATCEAFRLRPVEDPSNRNTSYDRVRVRKAVRLLANPDPAIPDPANPAATPVPIQLSELLTACEHLRTTADDMRGAVSACLRDCVTVYERAGYAAIDPEAFVHHYRSVDAGVAKLAMARVLAACSGREHTPGSKSVDAAAALILRTWDRVSGARPPASPADPGQARWATLSASRCHVDVSLLPRAVERALAVSARLGPYFLMQRARFQSPLPQWQTLRALTHRGDPLFLPAEAVLSLCGVKGKDIRDTVSASAPAPASVPASAHQSKQDPLGAWRCLPYERQLGKTEQLLSKRGLDTAARLAAATPRSNALHWFRTPSRDINADSLRILISHQPPGGDVLSVPSLRTFGPLPTDGSPLFFRNLFSFRITPPAKERLINSPRRLPFQLYVTTLSAAEFDYLQWIYPELVNRLPAPPQVMHAVPVVIAEPLNLGPERSFVGGWDPIPAANATFARLRFAAQEADLDVDTALCGAGLAADGSSTTSQSSSLVSTALSRPMGKASSEAVALSRSIQPTDSFAEAITRVVQWFTVSRSGPVTDGDPVAGTLKRITYASHSSPVNSASRSTTSRTHSAAEAASGAEPGTPGQFAIGSDGLPIVSATEMERILDELLAAHRTDTSASAPAAAVEPAQTIKAAAFESTEPGADMFTSEPTLPYGRVLSQSDASLIAVATGDASLRWEPRLMNDPHTLDSPSSATPGYSRIVHKWGICRRIVENVVAIPACGMSLLPPWASVQVSPELGARLFR
jgi:hypothetical protein